MNLELSLPPSVNKCFAGYPKRHKSDLYKNWLSLASAELLQQEKYRIIGSEWLEFNATFFLPLYCKNGKKKKQDLDNFLKPLLDFLGDNIEGFNDEHIKVINAEKKDSELNKVKLYIRETN